MVNKDIINKLLNEYEKNICSVVTLFNEKFNTSNPVKKWRNGEIQRIGFLDDKKLIEYSLHGAGCTVEFQDKCIVSFDFDVTDQYTFDLFKFKIFIESVNEYEKYSSIVDDFFNNIEVKIKNKKNWAIE